MTLFQGKSAIDCAKELLFSTIVITYLHENRIGLQLKTRNFLIFAFIFLLSLKAGHK